MIDDGLVDLLLVQESAQPDLHLPVLLYPNHQPKCSWKAVPKNGWGSGIYSRHGNIREIPVPEFNGWVVGAEISGVHWPDESEESLMVFSLHAPSVAESYAKQVNRILDELARIAMNHRIVIAGDFNLTVSVSQDSDRPTSKQDLAIQNRLANEFCLMNCWQSANPNLPLAQTLRWARDKSIPYHCDGIFVPKPWAKKLQSCEVLARPIWDKMSDHNPIVATFG